MPRINRSIRDFEEKLRSFERAYQAAITERGLFERDIAALEKKIADMRIIEIEVHRKKFLLERKKLDIMQIDRERRSLERDLIKLKKELTDIQQETGMRKIF